MPPELKARIIRWICSDPPLAEETRRLIETTLESIVLKNELPLPDFIRKNCRDYLGIPLDEIEPYWIMADRLGRERILWLLSGAIVANQYPANAREVLMAQVEIVTRETEELPKH